MIYVRKQAKDYGRQKNVDGVIKPGWAVVVIDDVIATGGSMTPAIKAIRSEGGKVEDTIVMIDRLEGARKNLRKFGVSLHSLTEILEVTEILYSKETIGVEERKAIISQVGRGKGQ